MPTQKPTPIRRKGCKNAGWIWDESETEKLVVKINPNKPFAYVTMPINYYKSKKKTKAVENRSKVAKTSPISILDESQEEK